MYATTTATGGTTELMHERLRQDAVEALGPNPHVYFIDRGDQLNEKAVAELVRTGYVEDWEDVLDADFEHESFRTTIAEAVAEVLRDWEQLHDATARPKDAWELDTEAIARGFEYSDAWYELRDHLGDVDASDPIKDLASNTPDVFVRVAVGDGQDVAVDDEDADGLVEAFGLPRTSPVRMAMRQIVPELYGGGQAYRAFLFGSVDVADVVALGPRGEDDELVLRGGALVVEDVWNGSGFSAALPADHAFVVPSARLRTDADQVGYAWDDVCGFVPGVYPVEVTKRATRAPAAEVA